MNPAPCHDYDGSEWVDGDGDIGPAIRELAVRAERGRWLFAVRVLLVVAGLWATGCIVGAVSRPWCD